MPKSLAPPHPKQMFPGFGSNLSVSVVSLKSWPRRLIAASDFR
jgi:hypothetical protein